MCWSLEASIAVGIGSWLIASYAWLRDATPRDRWVAMFTFVFSGIQWAEVGLWYVETLPGGLAACSMMNRVLTAGIIPLILVGEPLASEIGAWKAGVTVRRFPSLLWLILHGVAALVIASEALEFALEVIQDGVTERLCTSVDITSGRLLWWNREISLLSRLCFLEQILWPPVQYMQPRNASIVHALVGVSAWAIAMVVSPRTFGSTWCFWGNMLSILLLLDPYLFGRDWKAPKAPKAGGPAPGTIKRMQVSHRKSQ